MITNKITQLALYIQKLNKKEFRQYTIGILTAISLLALGITYYVHHVSSSLATQIKKITQQTNKISLLLAKNKLLSTEEQNVRILLDAQPNFNMNTYFEQFYTKHKMKPEPNWKPEEGAIITGSEAGINYQEIILKATFKNQTMKKLVTILQDIYKEQIIYLKGLEITAEKSKINFELTLATKQYKKEIESEA